MTILKELHKCIIEDLQEGEEIISSTSDVLSPAHHKESIKAKALELIGLLHRIVALNDPQAYNEFCSKVQQLSDTKVHIGLAVFIITRSPRILEYLTAAATLAYGNVQANRHGGRQALNAVWLFVARVLTNNYSLDIRILVCENWALVKALVPAALDSRVFLDAETGTQSGISKLCKVLDVFGLSTYWSGLMQRDLGKNVLNCVLTSVDKCLGQYQQDPTNSLVSIMETLRAVVLLTVVADDFSAVLSQDPQVAPRILRLVLAVSEFTDVHWAILNLLWLAEMSIVGFPNTSAHLGGPEDSVPLSFPVLISGHCLTLLHILGRNPVGAASLAACGGSTLRAIKKLVNIHTEDLLKKTGLWPMVVALIPSCSLGVTTSCNDPSLVSIRRLKHYNILLPCTCCSKVAIGSRQLKICGECHLIRYCGRECQQNDWQDGHNTLCKHFLTMK
eukprot:Gregarina_sp_Pseudo_9__567@NODE_1365_length_1661_cov_19_633169_g1275_i0_p1_GENE_NODE_1365_length_1661_cov_19_633169_g1275_i0NODE_1365_length_1661_cov_19_633169_g1275_i0_p1_ORF_typecomplete_len447_score58_33zfMYND/PF01753_18/1_8e03zfMYND/PF01753_18/1_5e08_NODE_1365_length_1661_cov_19_633169_g1275_i01741514